MRRSLGRTAVIGLLASSMVTMVGCGGGDFGTDVSLPPAERHTLTSAIQPGTTIRLPKSKPFNIHDKSWNATPGQDGTANAVADASPKGTASCKADAANGGSATAMFQLGHCIDNDSGKPMTVEVRMAIDYEHACQAKGEDPKNTANYAIKVFVKDTAGRVQQTLPLATHTTEDGRVQWSGTERTITEFTMRPKLGYYVVLTGRAQATSTAGASASAEVTVKSFTLDLRCEAAATEPPPATATTKKKG